jgi:hypothetical protein
MKDNIKEAIEEYQCPGCVSGCDISCFKKDEINESAACGKHTAGTMSFGTGAFFLGMPKGFNRLGHPHENPDANLGIAIYETREDGWQEPTGYKKWNIPVWKYLNEKGHTFVRGLSPRTNRPFLHVYLEDCMDQIDCLEITQEDVDYMD